MALQKTATFWHLGREDAIKSSKDLTAEELAICDYFDALRKNLPWCDELFHRHIIEFEQILTYVFLEDACVPKLTQLLDAESFKGKDVALFMQITRDFYDAHIGNTPGDHELTNLLAIAFIEGISAREPRLVLYYSPHMYAQYFKYDMPGGHPDIKRREDI